MTMTTLLGIMSHHPVTMRNSNDVGTNAIDDDDQARKENDNDLARIIMRYYA